MKKSSILVLTSALIWPLAAFSNDAHHPPATDTQAAASADSSLSKGEIRKVDKEQGKVTIKHGPLAKLDMPAMTMVFRVKDPAMLDQVNPGDQVQFTAEKIEGQFTVIRLEKQ